MASQSLISAVNSYDNYIQRKGIDEQVIDAYIEACRVAINGEKDITYGLHITNRSKGIVERFCMDRTGGRILDLEKYSQQHEEKYSLVDDYYKTLLIEAHYRFESFMLYMEKNRPVEERFYQPRINPLRQVAQLIQDLYDDVLDEGMVFCPGRIGKTQIVKMGNLWFGSNRPERSNLYSAYSDKITGGYYDGIIEMITDPTYTYAEIYPNIVEKKLVTDGKDLTVDLIRKKTYPTFTIIKESISAIADNLTPAMEFLTTTVIPDLQNAWTGLVDVLNPIGEFLKTAFTSIWQDMLNPALKYVGEEVLPKLQSAFENLWNGVLVPFGTFLGNILNPVIQIVADILTMLWQNVVVPLAQALGSVLGAAFDAIVDTMNFVVEQVKPVIEVFNFLWDNVLSPIVTHLWEDLKPAFETVFNAIGNIIKNLGTALKGLINFVSGVFTGNWRKAWDGIKDIFKGVFNGLVSIAEGCVNLIIDGINAFIDGFGLVSGISEAIGISFKPVQIPKISIPRFETGGYVPSRYTMFMAGENGIPEIAGTVGGKTAVAGGVEITGIKDAINSTAQQEIALLKQNNQLLQGILEKEFGITTDQIGIAARQYGQEQFNQKHKNVYVF